MIIAFLIILAIASQSCTLLDKRNSSDELEGLTKEVLKRNEGIEIEVRPIKSVSTR